MAFGRGRTEEETLMGETKPAKTGSNDNGGLTAFIDQGSSFEGKLSFKDTVRIDGSFRGQIASENTLVVGETGEIDANIESQTVIISGTVTGDIKASRKIVLHKTAVVQGNLEATTLVVEEGASLNGQMTMKVGSSAKASPLKSVEGGAPS
ncbi:MAG: hypothetical protein CL910_21005 [Deltaproteobacteria bacterium]|jgi:cytoskeletal protein CcmA (bactofilin family)|nr:hypothetical protein [Deltaproteobacteria bacterium]